MSYLRLQSYQVKLKGRFGEDFKKYGIHYEDKLIFEIKIMTLM